MNKTLAGVLCLVGIAFGLYLVRVDVVEAQSVASGVILDKQGVQPPVTTVDGSAVTLFSYVLPGGTLGPTDEIWVQTAFKHTTGKTSTTYAFAFGSASVLVAVVSTS